MKNKLKGMKGITLIALVITIIVLLILAGVSIATLTGENGILTQANNAKGQTKEAEAEEIFKLVANEWQIEKRKGTSLGDFLDDKEVEYGIKATPEEEDYVLEYNGDKIKIDSNGTLTEVTSGGGKEQAKVGEIVTGSNKYYTTEDGTAKIPVGYMIVPGCEDISEGLVISDNPADTEVDLSTVVAEGNQFVWIPVTNPDKYERNKSYSNTNISTTAHTDTGYLPEGIQPETDDAISNEAAEKKAVLDAGGFYIGRYEAGDSSATTDFRSSETEGTLVCQKNKYPYAYIIPTNAKAKAKTFIPADNTANVKSALISGIQWDVVMDTINNKLDGNEKTYNVTKAESDRHTTKEAQTGQNIADKVYNIYDLEGNFFEYVAERSPKENFTFIRRGGHYSASGSYSASYRYEDAGKYPKIDFTFRLVLYVM